MSNPIPFVDLKREYATMQEEIENAMKEVIATTTFITGPQLTVFEKEFAAYCGKKYAVGVASGTDALTLSIRAYGIKNAEIITCANTFVATVLAIKYSGNIPVLVDADETGNIDITKIEEKITHHTRAILPVHLYGNPVNMDTLQVLAEKYNLIIIEDACQAHGATLHGKKIPLAETGCFSFYPAKNLGCFGDGGMIVTENEEVYNILKQLREYGSKEKYYHELEDGFNSRLDTLQAAVLNVKLKYLQKGNVLRQEAAAVYRKLLPESIVLPAITPHAEHVYHLFTILVQQRDALRAYLKERGVATGIHYPVPLHLQKMLASLGHKQGDFPVAEKFAQQTLSLPIFPYITKEEIETVCNAIQTFFEEK